MSVPICGIPEAQLGIILPKRATEQFREGAGKLDAGRPSAHNSEGQPLPPLLWVRQRHRTLKAVKDVVSQTDCLVKALQRISVLSSPHGKEIRGAPRCQDEVIV